GSRGRRRGRERAAADTGSFLDGTSAPVFQPQPSRQVGGAVMWPTSVGLPRRDWSAMEGGAMPQRLTPLEVSLLVLDTAHAPAHVATVDLFDAQPDGLDYERLIALIRERIAYVPRYRQRVRDVPARLAAPVWVDDESFDLTFHVRRSALPRPGTLEQLRAIVSRVVARRMDRSRPLWEMYVVEGLEGDRFAVVAKTHLTLVDGVDNVDIGQVLVATRPATG